MAKESPAWKKAIQEGRKVTLIIFACNTGSYSFMQEHSDNPAQNNILKINSMPFGLKVSKSEIFENVIVLPAQLADWDKENEAFGFLEILIGKTVPEVEPEELVAVNVAP